IGVPLKFEAIEAGAAEHTEHAGQGGQKLMVAAECTVSVLVAVPAPMTAPLSVPLSTRMPRLGARKMPFATATGLKICTSVPDPSTLKSTFVYGTPPDRLIAQPLQMKSPVRLRTNSS